MKYSLHNLTNFIIYSDFYKGIKIEGYFTSLDVSHQIINDYNISKFTLDNQLGWSWGSNIEINHILRILEIGQSLILENFYETFKLQNPVEYSIIKKFLELDLQFKNFQNITEWEKWQLEMRIEYFQFLTEWEKWQLEMRIEYFQVLTDNLNLVIDDKDLKINDLTVEKNRVINDLTVEKNKVINDLTVEKNKVIDDLTVEKNKVIDDLTKANLDNVNLRAELNFVKDGLKEVNLDNVNLRAEVNLVKDGLKGANLKIAELKEASLATDIKVNKLLDLIKKDVLNIKEIAEGK